MSDAQNDKRRGPRRRVLKGGIVAFNDRRSTLPCIVRDISETGARLRMETMSVLAPDRFLLIIELHGIEAECKVVRRKADEVAVEFTSPPRKLKPRRSQSIRALVPEAVPALRRKS
jgi:hypothetical protein